MKTRTNSMLMREECCPFGILHENHRAYRRDCLTKNTVERTVSGINISPPIIRIDEQGRIVLSCCFVPLCLMYDELHACMAVSNVRELQSAMIPKCLQDSPLRPLLARDVLRFTGRAHEKYGIFQCQCFQQEKSLEPLHLLPSMKCNKLP